MNSKQNAEMTRHSSRRLIAIFAFAYALSVSSSPLFAKNGAFRETKHGDRARGPQRLTSVPRGSCQQCHLQHGSHDPSLRSVGGDTKGLFGRNDNEICFSCHATTSETRVWPGSMPWMQSGHATSSLMVWPGRDGSARPASDANKCVNCHDPHGNRDARGVIPSLLPFRQSALCQECHDGSHGADVRSQFAKTYTHPLVKQEKHDVAENDAKAFGAIPDDRHAECADCHNPHLARADAFAPTAPEASNRITAVSRVQAINGAAGAKPIYTFRAADDTSLAAEYELCFKCHSGWTRQPAGQSDLAVLTNPENASYHPVQSIGKNRDIDPAAFTSGWSWDRQVYCTDCHSSDDSTVRGPHGSAYRFILKKPATVTPLRQAMQPDDLCFDCHRYEVYANPNARPEELRASRFNGPSVAGHAYHVGLHQIPCYGCHETHGSVRQLALISLRRMPGMSSYVQSATGGTCGTTCHDPRTYEVNYRR